jgi:Staphylococcal nuclease homologue
LAERLAESPAVGMVKVRVIGIKTPPRSRCGTDQATAYLEQLALRRNVTLVSDPTQGERDSNGLWLYYVDRNDGLDVGREMLRAGWAEVFVSQFDFQRLPAYRDAAADAARSERGVWTRCDGDFQRPRALEVREQRTAAADFVRLYYRRVSSRQFAAAWGMLTRAVRRELGPFASWRAGYRRSLGVSVLSARSRLSGGQAVVSIRLRSRDRDACSHRIVRQHFSGRWVLAPRENSWTAAKVVTRKTGGGLPRLATSECRARESGK